MDHPVYYGPKLLSWFLFLCCRRRFEDDAPFNEMLEVLDRMYQKEACFDNNFIRTYITDSMLFVWRLMRLIPARVDMDIISSKAVIIIPGSSSNSSSSSRHQSSAVGSSGGGGRHQSSAVGSSSSRQPPPPPLSPSSLLMQGPIMITSALSKIVSSYTGGNSSSSNGISSGGGGGLLPSGSLVQLVIQSSQSWYIPPYLVHISAVFGRVTKVKVTTTMTFDPATGKIVHEKDYVHNWYVAPLLLRFLVGCSTPLVSTLTGAVPDVVVRSASWLGSHLLW